jgi:hypothetical protein
MYIAHGEAMMELNGGLHGPGALRFRITAGEEYFLSEGRHCPVQII